MNKEQILELLSNSYTIITIIGAIAIFFYQRNKIRDERFKQYAASFMRCISRLTRFFSLESGMSCHSTKSSMRRIVSLSKRKRERISRVSSTPAGA